MRILVASSNYYPYTHGQAVFTINLAEGLAKQGHEVLVVTQSERGVPYKVVRNGVHVNAVQAVSLGLWYSGQTISIFPKASVRTAFESFQPDIVHIQDHYPISRYVFYRAQKLGIRVIGTNHFMPENLEPYLQSVAWFKPAYQWVLWQWMLDLYNRLDLATGPSATAAELMHQQGLKVPVYPVSCGVDIDRFRPLPDLDRGGFRQRYGLDPDRILFLFVGRVDGEKRLDVLLQAASLLKRDDIQIAIAGKGAALKNLKRLARHLGLDEQVCFLGYIPPDDLPSLLNSADVFTMPSDAELLSIATLEAMACGLPILAARAHALPELVQQGTNGYLFRNRDAGNVAYWMNVLADERERWPAMKAASLARVQSHSLDNVIRRYLELYEVVLSAPARQPEHLHKTLVKLVRKYML